MSNYKIDDIYFWQKDDIKQHYDNIAKYHNVSLNFYRNTRLEEKNNVKISLLSAIKFSELKKLILTNDENIKERLFVENPRAHLGDTNVNNDIRSTITSEQYNHYFIYLNNGLTILCDTIENHPTKETEYILTYPRIINGCQTTHILYDQFKKQPDHLNNIEVIVKVIATKDNELKKRIIFAANNQNSIDKDLQSLNEFHEKIEQHFQGARSPLDLYFERLRGQYSNISPPYKKINIENLAKIYVSVFLQKPHEMKSTAITKIGKYQKSNEIFNIKDNTTDYYYCGILYYWLNKFLLTKELALASKTMDMHLLLACDLFLEKKLKDTTEKVKFLSKEEDAKNIFTSTHTFVKEEKYLFERRGFYSSPKTSQLIKDIQKK